MKIIKAIVVLAGCFLIGACVTNPPKPEISSQTSNSCPDARLETACVVERQWEPESSICPIDIEIQYLLFKLRDIEIIIREKGSVEIDSLMSLYRKGEGELICAPKILANPGQEASKKDVVEYIYPTSFTWLQPDATNSPITIKGGVVEPSNFETREVGQLFTVTATISPTSREILIVLASEIVEEPIWKDYGSTYKDHEGKTLEVKMEQPFFKSNKLSTSIAVAPCVPTLIGGGTYNRKDGKLMYTIVTARVIDSSGKTIKK